MNRKEIFDRDGFVAVQALITPDQVSELLLDYERVLRGEIPVSEFEGPKRKGPMIQLANPSQRVPGWQQHPYFLRAREVASELLGCEAEYGYDQLIFKPPHSSSPTAWHQDAGYWRGWKGSLGTERALTCWLALAPAFLENGCMQFIPGSHRGEVRAHFSVADRSEIANALATEVDASRAVACPLRPGDASFHHCRTLHYTGGNHTDVPRHALITHFIAV